MFNSSVNLCKFSPLRTPHMKNASKKKPFAEDGYVSGSSVGSSVTGDIISLSQSIQRKLKSEKLSGSQESSDGENLFITQVRSSLN